MPIEIRQFPCLSDNYGFLVRDTQTGAVASIDTPDAEAIDRELAEAHWTLTHILNTHWHFDHTGGNLALKNRWGARIIGPKDEAGKIPGLDEEASDGSIVALGASQAVVHAAPGHTLGHIIFHFADDCVAFVGDTIFVLGCGRLFEGTPQQMWNSLSRIAQLPPRTKLYCAHEYTQSNARFALSVDPSNDALTERAREIDRLRSIGAPTVPTTVADELRTNPFLRASDPAFGASLGLASADPAEIFAEIRHRKDAFK